MVEGVLRLSELSANDEMIPRVDMVSYDLDLPAEARNAALDDLLVTFVRSGKPLAIGLDEYGGTAGLISRSDILEIIFGLKLAFSSVSRGRILHVARQGGRRARIVQSAMADVGRSLTALLVGNNLSAVSFSSASAALLAAAFPSSPLAQTVWSVVAAFFMLYAGEFLPKLLCSARPLRRLLQLAPAWRVFAKAFLPVGDVVQVVIRRLLPRRVEKPKVTPETVLKILEDRKDGVRLSDFESALIGRIMVLRSTGRPVTPETLLPTLAHDLL